MNFQLSELQNNIFYKAKKNHKYNKDWININEILFNIYSN